MPYNLLDDQRDVPVDMSYTHIVDTAKPMNRAPSVLLRLDWTPIACSGMTEKQGQEKKGTAT